MCRRGGRCVGGGWLMFGRVVVDVWFSVVYESLEPAVVPTTYNGSARIDKRWAGQWER